MRCQLPSLTAPLILWAIVLTSSCHTRHPLFVPVTPAHSDIHFNNQITESDSINILDLSNVYNGGGIGIGDFNNDGWQDIYFTGNLVSNKLYLNKGDFRFSDITETAQVTGEGRWCRGVAVIDINNDGWLDIYICVSMSADKDRRRNLLYINQGNDQQGIPHFREMAAEYGLNDTSYSTMANFFDYDNDGDLDLYITVNQITGNDNPSQFRPIHKDGSHPGTGRLYRNDWNQALGHPVFTDVSKQAGITIEGYGHAATVADINRDGWKDIYVTNDYLSGNLLYINNHDGTFTDRSAVYFKHTSANAMGQDVIDINNDGLADVIELDMNPEDNYRKKMMLNGNNYNTYQNSDYFGYPYQYVRNTLQVNQGNRVNGHDSIGDPVFSEMAFYSGIAETDWSWTPLVADMDNDGFRDIIITNGFPKDITDHDFVTFRNRAMNLVSKRELLKQIPEVKLANYAYRNNGDLSFSQVSKEWGLTEPSFSNGAVYADLDNDGDLDLVINNINDKAMLYRNMAREQAGKSTHFLQVRFAGDTLNRNGLGAWVELYFHGKQQVYENSPYRGYLSSIQSMAHFGLGVVVSVDSLLFKWPNGLMQTMRNVPVDQVITADITHAQTKYNLTGDNLVRSSLFRDVSNDLGVQERHEEEDFIDFNIQKLLPHKLSEYGPALAVGDINGDGLDDLVCGGSAHHSARILLQQPNGRFLKKDLLSPGQAKIKNADDLGILLFDADGDGDLDLYIISGGYENEAGSQDYQDRLYVNDGKGNFSLAPGALPANFVSKACVRAVDFDHDGDLDLFVSGRVQPGRYPSPVSSFIYRNDSRNGEPRFTDVTREVAPDLVNIGMVCDALWTDFDNDGWEDLLLAGEWMPIMFLKNNRGIFENVTDQSGVSKQKGWWNSIVAADVDNDGNMDYIVGNLGLNSFYRAGPSTPVRAYGKDFDANAVFDMIPSLYLPDREGMKKEFPAQGRDDLLKQVNAFRKKFPTYQSYAQATMDDLLTDDQRKDALVLEANYFASSLLRNEGNGRFSLLPLPVPAQISSVYGMVADDVDGDGNPDLILNGNDFGTEVFVGRYDALNGLYLQGDGKGGFTPKSIMESGIFIPGNGRALVKYRSASGKYMLVASQNRGALKFFELKKDLLLLRMQPSDRSALLTLKNGRTQKQELYHGHSFLSQSGRWLSIGDQVISIEITGGDGKKRTGTFSK